jgi:hypothetical protein
MDPITSRVYLSRHVVFDGNLFPAQAKATTTLPPSLALSPSSGNMLLPSHFFSINSMITPHTPTTPFSSTNNAGTPSLHTETITPPLEPVDISSSSQLETEHSSPPEVSFPQQEPEPPSPSAESPAQQDLPLTSPAAVPTSALIILEITQDMQPAASDRRVTRSQTGNLKTQNIPWLPTLFFHKTFSQVLPCHFPSS